MKKLTLVVAVFALCSCVSPMIQVKKDVGPLAADSMKCAEDKLVFEDTQQVMVIVTRVKVKGCGKETIWKMEESRWKKE